MMKMKVWHKILVAPALAIVFLIVLGAMSYSVLKQQHATLDEMYNTRFSNYQFAANSSREVGEVHSNVYRLFTWLSNIKEDKIKQVMDEQNAKINAVTKSVSQYGKRADLNAGERKIAESILKKLAKYKSDVEMAVDLSSVDINTGMSAMQTADGGFQEMDKEFKALVQIEKKTAQESYDKANGIFNKTLVLVLAILVVAFSVSTATALYMSRMIVRPLGDAIDIAGNIARGDLTSEITVVSRDETGQLMQALKDMNDSLSKVVGEVRAGTDTMAIATGKIADGNLDLSARTEQQTSSLEKTAFSVEELTGTVKQNADNARQANQLAMSASDVAIKGGAVVAQVVDTMGSINESARKIVDIIGVIDGIAFQTNILALNAAVEAARAGEQGRGFAVVASEVRNLAQRSASAAKEIKTLIGDSVEKVDVGTKLVGQAGSTMQEIVESVKRVTDVMAEITNASQEQTSGIDQINQAIAQMDEVTQQNAALVKDAAVAAASLQDQAGNLAQVVSVFKLDAGHSSAPAAAALGNAARKAGTADARPGAHKLLRAAGSSPQIA